MSMEVGRLSGELTALKERVGRHETFVGEKLATLDVKLDMVLERQSANQAVNKAARWGLTILVGASGWIDQLLHGVGGSSR